MINESENSIQAAFFKWLAVHEKRFPELALFYAIPNGANKSVASRMKFQREGLKSGVPDCHLPLQGRWQGINWSGLWIEFKSAKGRVTTEQKAWITNLRANGHVVYICRSWTEAANITIDYLGLNIPKL